MLFIIKKSYRTFFLVIVSYVALFFFQFLFLSFPVITYVSPSLRECVRAYVYMYAVHFTLNCCFAIWDVIWIQLNCKWQCHHASVDVQNNNITYTFVRWLRVDDEDDISHGILSGYNAGSWAALNNWIEFFKKTKKKRKKNNDFVNSFKLVMKTLFSHIVLKVRKMSQKNWTIYEPMHTRVGNNKLRQCNWSMRDISFSIIFYQYNLIDWSNWKQWRNIDWHRC